LEDEHKDYLAITDHIGVLGLYLYTGCLPWLRHCSLIHTAISTERSKLHQVEF